MHAEINSYLNWKGTYANEKTVKCYGPWIVKFNEVIGKKIEDVDFEDIVKFNSLIKKSYAPKSVQLAMTVVHNYFSFWKRRKNINIILEDIKIPKARPKSHEPITPNDYVSILAQIDVNSSSGHRDCVIVRMLYDTGVRIGELRALDVSNIDHDTNSAIIETEKTNKKRRIFWSKDTSEFLKYYLIDRQDYAKIGEKALFINLSGERLSTRSIERNIQNYCKLAGIEKKIVPHSFRHGKAHLILDNGGTIKDIQYILGHQSPASSFHYLNLSDAEQIKRAVSFF